MEEHKCNDCELSSLAEKELPNSMEMKDIIICSDFDDTINNLLPAWISWLNNEYNYTVKVDHIQEWNLSKYYPNLSKEQIYSPLYTEEFWKTVSIKSDAVEYITKLIDEGAQFYIATASPYHNIRIKVESCLLPYWPEFDSKRLITIYNKQLLNCTFLIDDYVDNLIGGNYIKVLMDAPHNQNSNGIEDFRVTSWKEIYEIIHQYIEAHNYKGVH